MHCVLLPLPDVFFIVIDSFHCNLHLFRSYPPSQKEFVTHKGYWYWCFQIALCMNGSNGGLTHASCKFATQKGTCWLNLLSKLWYHSLHLLIQALWFWPSSHIHSLRFSFCEDGPTWAPTNFSCGNEQLPILLSWAKAALIKPCDFDCPHFSSCSVLC